MRQIDINIVEAIIRSAVVDNHNEELRQLEEDTGSISYSDVHEKRMKQLFAHAQVKRSIIHVWVITKKAATAAAILVAVLSSIMLFNPKIQAAVMEVITEFFSQFTSFRFDNSEEETMGYVEWGLGWLPELFSETYREYDGGESRATYTDSSGKTIRFTAIPTKNRQINVDNEHSEYSVKTTDGVEYHIFTSFSDEAPSVIIWVNKGYSFSVSSYCDVDTLEMMAFSVHEVGG